MSIRRHETSFWKERPSTSIDSLAELFRDFLTPETSRLITEAGQTKNLAEFAKFADDIVGYAETVLGVRWWSKQVEVALSVVNHPRTFVKASHTVGKCLGVDELVTLADGARIPAGDLVGKNFRLLTLDHGKAIKTWARAEWNTTEPVYQITTESGRKIIRNAHHPLWAATVKRSNGTHPVVKVRSWQSCSALQRGDCIALTRELPAFGRQTINEDLLKVVAYLIGDGGLTANAIRFTQMNGPVLEEMKACVDALDCELSERPRKSQAREFLIRGKKRIGSRGRLLRPRMSSIRIAMLELNLQGKHSRDKRIPQAFFELSKPLLQIFLSRLYATDGWAAKSANRCMEIGFCSASEGLCRDLQHLLLRFGIRASVAKKPNIEAWAVSIRDRAGIERFAREIGIFGKEQQVAAVLALCQTKRRPKGKWRYRNALPGTLWETIVDVTVLPAELTVAIEVPRYNTFLTDFYEHNTHLAGGIVNWHFDCFSPSITKTTAPTKNQVVDLTWKEVRLQRRGRDMLPKAARIESYTIEGQFNPSHFAAGYTAKDADSFQGDHEEHLGIIFEEAVGIHEQFWTAAEGMLSSGPGNWWLAIMNPTDTTSHAYQQELSGDWNVISISALEHPNLAAELRNKPKPFPKAISLSWVEERIRKWCEVIPEKEKKATDFCWPPKDFCRERGIQPVWYRPGPLFEGRVLGRWPSQSTEAVWSEAMWNRAIEHKPELWKVAARHPPEVGCDRARYGDDSTSIHVRRGPVSLEHETHNGWNTTRTLFHLKEMAKRLGFEYGLEAKKVLVKVDDFQGGVVDPAHDDGWNFVDINSASKAFDEEGYPNRRSELWFDVAERAENENIDLSALDDASKTEIRRQAMAPKWKPNGSGQRVVEEKLVTKKRIKRSPDDMDALNLAYAAPGRMLELPKVGPKSVAKRSSPWRLR